MRSIPKAPWSQVNRSTHLPCELTFPRPVANGVLQISPSFSQISHPPHLPLLQNPDQTPISCFPLRLFSTPRSTRLYAKIMCIYITTATLWAIIYKKYAHQEVLASLTKGERFFFPFVLSASRRHLI